jgi:hypothetical protein
LVSWGLALVTERLRLAISADSSYSQLDAVEPGQDVIRQTDKAAEIKNGGSFRSRRVH